MASLTNKTLSSASKAAVQFCADTGAASPASACLLAACGCSRNVRLANRSALQPQSPLSRRYRSSTSRAASFRSHSEPPWRRGNSGAATLTETASRTKSLRPPVAHRDFHTYFVTHLPSSSLHPDSHRLTGPGHKLPRDASTPHTPTPGSAPAVSLPNMPSRDLTVVRIPLRRAKHHFGSATARGDRPYNEDTDQAGIIDLPAFAKRAPMNIRQKPGEAISADSHLGDPQVFYFGVFDGHGGTQCSHFLRDELHGYLEEAVTEFGLQSSLRKPRPRRSHSSQKTITSQGALDSVDMKGTEVTKDMNAPSAEDNGFIRHPKHGQALTSAESIPVEVQDYNKVIGMEKSLIQEYKDTIGGYFRRFNPDHFDIRSEAEKKDCIISLETALAYGFLRADLDFVSAQARKVDPEDTMLSDTPLNNDEILGLPHATPSGHDIGGATRFKGGSTASIALISTPTPVPFWHPGAQSTMIVAHVGDTRVLLCDTATGLAVPLTTDHHPDSPQEGRRLRRYAPAGSMVSSDSFGEERIAGLANSRAFGDIKSKRIGVSAEPEIIRVELGPAQYSFLVLMSDGVSGTLSDQEIVDVVKEAKTPEEGARRVVEYATMVSDDGDNATCQVVRMGGWERRSEGGVGSLGTKEIRDIRRGEALNPRRRNS